MNATLHRIFMIIVCVMGWPVLPASAQWLSPGPIVPAVTLQDDQGRSWRLDELVRRRPVLIGFFFTGCSTVCPPQTATMRDVRTLVASASSEAPLLLSISLDPLDDTPEAMRIYARQFDVELGPEHGWLMLTGSLTDLRKVWAAFEQPEGNAAEHAATLWVGQPMNRRWTRTSGLGAAEPIAGLLLENPG